MKKMRIIQLIIAIIAVLLSTYSLVTKNYDLSPYTNFLLSIFLILLGVSQFQEDKRGTAIFLFFAASFNIIVNIYIVFN